jgi:hypothetical protein
LPQCLCGCSSLIPAEPGNKTEKKPIVPTAYSRAEGIFMANTKTLSREDRKKAKRAARKKAAPKAKRTVPRGSMKRKVKKMARGTAKR